MMLIVESWSPGLVGTSRYCGMGQYGVRGIIIMQVCDLTKLPFESRRFSIVLVCS
jgi:hypothetical protein